MAGIKDLLNKFREDDDEDLELDDSDQDEAEQRSADVLEQLRVPAETVVEEGIKTSTDLSDVRYRIARPEGYFFEDVEEAHNEFLRTTRWLEKALHQRDLDVHKLATHIDQLNTDYQNLQFQLEAFSAKGKVITDETGKPIVVKGDAELVDIEDLQRRLLASETQRSDLEAWAIKAKSHIEELEAQLNNADTPVADDAEVAAQIAQMQQTIDQLTADNAAQAEWIQQASEALEAYAARENELANETHAPQETANATSDADDHTADLEAQLEAALAEVDQLRAQLADVPAVSEGGLSDEERTHFEQLKAWGEEVQVEYARMEDELTGTKNALESTQADLDSVKSELENTHSELAAAQAALAEAHNELSETRNALEAVQSDLTAKDKYIVDLTAWADDVEARLAAMQEGGETVVSNVEIVNEADESDVQSVAAAESVQPEVADESDEDAFTPVQEQVEDDDDEDDFARKLREVKESETGEPARRPLPRRGGYAPARPGAPLSSLPPDVNIEDYL